MDQLNKLTIKQQKFVEAYINNSGNGTDMIDNMIILRLNNHHLFDAYGFSINDDLSLIGKEESLSVHRKHSIHLENIRYHRSKYQLAIQE